MPVSQKLSYCSAEIQVVGELQQKISCLVYMHVLPVVCLLSATAESNYTELSFLMLLFATG